MLRMDDDQKDLLDFVSDSPGPSGPFAIGLPVAGIIAVGLIILIVLYVTQHPNSFLAHLFTSRR